MRFSGRGLASECGSRNPLMRKVTLAIMCMIKTTECAGWSLRNPTLCINLGVIQHLEKNASPPDKTQGKDKCDYSKFITNAIPPDKTYWMENAIVQKFAIDNDKTFILQSEIFHKSTRNYD